MTHIEVMKQALEALEDLLDDTDPPPILRILRQAIEQAEKQEPAVPPGYVLVPIEPTQGMITAMSTSKAKDSEGEFPMLLDLIDYSGENKTYTVLKAAYAAMLATAPTPKETT